jgi:hypothetical protein
MKKLLALMLAVACLFALTSCGGLSEDDAREVAEGFLDAFLEMDTEKMLEFVDDKDELPEEFEEGLGALKENLIDELGDQLGDYEEQLADIIDTLIEKCIAVLEYEITEVKQNDDSYEFTVEITAPGDDFEDSLKSALNNKLNTNAIQQIVTRLMQEGKITATSTQKEISDALMPELLKLIEDVIDDIEIETETTENTLVVYETEDGEVLIDAKKSDLD